MPYKDRAVALSGYACAGCGCQLEPYEVMACKIRGLKKPVCIGCLASALVTVKDHIYPLLEAVAKRYFDLAAKQGTTNINIDLTTSPPTASEREKAPSGR